jgi:hypothetical protein
VLLAGENSGQSYLLSAQIRQTKPQQRIALLVGPPLYIREVARGAKRGFQASHVQAGSAVTPPASSLDAEAPPQWQQIIQKVVSDWYSTKC